MPEPETDLPLPSIGSWYRDATGAMFEVVAVDEDDATVEIQHFDGTIEELDLGDWFDVAMETVEPPEDWSGSLDIEREDYGVDLDDASGEDWQNPLDALDHLGQPD